MSSVSQINVLTTADQLTSAIWNQEMANLYSGLTSIGTPQLAAKAVTIAKAANDLNPAKREFHHGFVGYVSSGWTFAAATTLSDATLAAGIAYVRKTSSEDLIQIDRSSGPIPVPTLTANVENFVFLKADNTLRASTSATLAADELLVISLTTNATTVTSNSFKARSNPFQNVGVMPNYIEGLLIERTSNTNITVQPGNLDIDGVGLLTSTADIVLNLSTAVFAAGSWAADTTVRIYAKSNGSGGITLVPSTDAPNISDKNSGTSGHLRYRIYTSVLHRYLGQLRTNASTQIKNFEMSGDSKRPFIKSTDTTNVEGIVVLTAGASTAFADVDCSTFVPLTSTEIVLWLQTTGNLILTLAQNGGTPPENPNFFDTASDRDQRIWWVDANGIFEYKVNTGTATIFVTGYWDRR